MKQFLFITNIFIFSIVLGGALFAAPIIENDALSCSLEAEDGVSIVQQGNFVELQRTLRIEEERIGSIFPFTFNIEGKGKSHFYCWTSLGTDRLKKKGQKSATFMVWANPNNNQGLVAAWETQFSGSGSLELRTDPLQLSAVKLIARLDYGNKAHQKGADFTTEKLVIGYFDDIREGLAQYADLLVKSYDIHLKPQPNLYCTWYHNYNASTPEKIRTTAEFAQKHFSPWGFDVIQLDDGWQAGDSKKNGPNKNFTQVHPEKAYAQTGMKATADDIKRCGLTPGIWFMPFAGSYNDPWFADKQDFFIKRKNGKPFDTFWGGTCLDFTNPKVQDYLRKEVQQLNQDWGYQYFKIDGLWTGTGTDILNVNKGYRPDDNIDDSVFFNPQMSNIESYRMGLKIVNETTNNKAFILGCNLGQNMRVLGGSFGLVDGMRVGMDNGPSWEEMRRGPEAITNLYFLNKKVWYNDPDPTYVRNEVPYTNARTLTSFIGFTGSLHTTSEDYTKLNQRRIELIQKTIPSHHELALPCDLLQHEIAEIWKIDAPATPTKSATKLLGIFNWNTTDRFYHFNLAELGLAPEQRKSRTLVGFDFWQEEYIDAGQLNKKNYRTRVNDKDCQIVAFKLLNENAQVIATNRHVGCGLVDVIEEKPGENKLELTLEVPPTDDYKIFVVPPEGRLFDEDAVRVQVLSGEAEVDDFDDKENGQLLEIELDTFKKGEVKLLIQFL